MLANGGHVWLLRRLPGRSHQVYLAREADTDRLIVVKTGGNTDVLYREAAALSWLTLSGAAVPKSSGILIDHHGRPVLMLQYLDGHHLRSPADFAEAGRALATFHAVSLSSHIPTSQALPYVPIQTVMSSAGTLARAVGLDLAPLALRLMAIPACDLSCIHGDASTSNILITPSGTGVLLDLGNAHIGHPGLDVGRFLFLASQTAATADMLAGFLAGYGRPPVPAGDLNDWIAVAGLQIAIWRARNARWGLSAVDAVARVASWLGAGLPVTGVKPAPLLSWSGERGAQPRSVT
jgi:Ser/Thr protein kinase RdoA (MazF antagonist)